MQGNVEVNLTQTIDQSARRYNSIGELMILRDTRSSTPLNEAVGNFCQVEISLALAFEI